MSSNATQDPIQPLDINALLQGTSNRTFKMIDNYIYLYHTETLIAIPTYPETIADSMAVNYQSTTPLSRSAPIYSYISSGPRSFNVSLALHRDLMNEINVSASNLNVDNLWREDYIDILVKQIHAAALPRYAASEKLVDPPIVAVRFGQDIFCKGVITGAVTVTYTGPILANDKYAQVNIDFTINEIDPYDAETSMQVGGYRGLNKDLERKIWRVTS